MTAHTREEGTLFAGWYHTDGALRAVPGSFESREQAQAFAEAFERGELPEFMLWELDEEAGAAVFQWSGTIAEFAVDNDEEIVEELRGLDVGDTATLGGGALAVVRVQRCR